VKVNDAIKVDHAGAATCANCGKGLGLGSSDPLAGALRTERPSMAAGPGVRADPKLFADRPIVLRQTFCPQCRALLSTEIVPGDEVSYRHWHVKE
jgi:N-methylhydantoinase B